MASRPEVVFTEEDWFKKELGAKNHIELQPTLKSAVGQIKAKMVEKGHQGRQAY